MSRREDRDRFERERQRDVDRDRENRRVPTQRQNEYFLPKDGIDREVITADICRYLGQDALVRPGVRPDPQTRQPQEGYIISAYRNLTSAMITDLKADSLRWENERRNATRTPYAYEQYPSSYATSQTHRARHEQGPSSSSASMAPSIYTTSATSNTAYDDNAYGRTQQQYAPASYAQPVQDYPMQQAYTYGSNLEPQRPAVPAQPVSSAYPRDTQYASTTPVYSSTSGYGYGQQPPQQSTYGQPQQPTDPSYGRAVPVTGATYEQPEYYSEHTYDTSGRGYATEQTQYSQPMVSTPSTSTIPADTNPSRRPHGHRDGHSKHPRSDNRR